MWQLLAGELFWGLRQLAANPWLALGLAGGVSVAFAALSTAAPGPVLDTQWRLLVAIVAGLVVSTGIRELQQTAAGRNAEPARGDHHRPLLGAAIVSATATVLILLTWLIVWLIGLLV